jgi:nucleotide-binding universal stress UspA family protein
MGWLVALGTAWVVLGGASAVLMVRRGHEVATWSMLGLVFGPLAPLVALASAWSEGRVEPRTVAEGTPSHGNIDILVGIDGSRQAIAAARAAVALHGATVGRLVLARVIPFDATDDPDGAAALSEAAAAVAPLQPTTVELHGEPVAALRRYAADEGMELLVVGARGRGRSTSPLGSVALRLASEPAVPVLIGPAARS